MESPILRHFMVSIERVSYVWLFGNSNVVASNSLDPELSDLREIEATGDNHNHFDKAFGIHSNVEDRAHQEHHRHGLQRPNQAAGGNFHTQKDDFLYVKLFHVTSEAINRANLGPKFWIFLAAISFHACYLVGCRSGRILSFTKTTHELKRPWKCWRQAHSSKSIWTR